MKIFFGFLVLTVLVFLPALSAEFLAYDDRLNIVANPFLLQHNFLHFWTQSYFNLFVPVVYSVWTFLHLLFGANAAVFHFVNIALHAGNAWLLFQICSRFKVSHFACWIAGAVFLLHPLQVESVAWATGLKDVLSLFLCLVAINLFFAGQNKILIFSVLVLALLTKPGSGVVPLLLLVASFYRGSLKQNWYLAVALLAGIGNLLFSKFLQDGAELGKVPDTVFFQRIVVMLDSLGFYVSKFFVPLGLYPDYGRTPQFVQGQGFLFVAVALVFLGGLGYLFCKIQNRFFYGFIFLMAGLFFLPVSGLVPFGFQNISTVADRYFYPMAPAFAVLLAGGYDFYVLQSKKLTQFAAYGFLAVLAVCSFAQTLSWQNNQVFFEYMLEGNSQSFNATNNLGVLAQLKGDDDKAIEYFLKAKELRPLELTPVAGLISVYSKRHDHPALDAIAEQYLTEKQFKKMVLPGHSTSIALKLYGYSLLERQRPAEAQDYFCRAAVLSQPVMNELVPVIDKIAKDTGRNCPGRP